MTKLSFEDDFSGVNLAIDNLLQDYPGATVERFDAASAKGSAIATAASTVSLFSSGRIVIVSNAAKFTAASARLLVESETDSVVVFTGSSGLSAAVRKIIDVESRQVFKVPDFRKAPAFVAQLLESAGVSAESEAVTRTLGEAVRTPLGIWRVRSLLAICGMVGISKLDHPTVNSFVSDLSSPTAVWSIADAVVSGRVDYDFVVDDLEPVVMLSLVASRLGRLACYLECSDDLVLSSELLAVSSSGVSNIKRGFKGDVASVPKAFDVIMEASTLCRQVSGEIERRSIASAACTRAASLLAPTNVTN